MRRVFQGRAGLALAFTLGLVIATAGSATAARLITGKQIKNGTITKSDLSKALRAQLAKAGSPGSPGPKGDAGAKGDQGPVGPTEAVVAASGGYPYLVDLSATPDQVWDVNSSTTFATTRSGRLLLSLTTFSRVGVDCSAGLGYIGVILDGTPVPQSAALAPSIAERQTVTRDAVTGVVPAGSHTVTLATDCPDGNLVNSYYGGGLLVSAVVTGG